MGTHIIFDGHQYNCYHYNMKTTVELSDSLMTELEQAAADKGATMRELIESALRIYLDQQKAGVAPYRFTNHSFKGQGVCEGIEEGAWETIRGMIYEGRGGWSR